MSGLLFSPSSLVVTEPSASCGLGGGGHGEQQALHLYPQGQAQLVYWPWHSEAVGGQWGSVRPEHNRLLYTGAYASALVEALPGLLLLLGLAQKRGLLPGVCRARLGGAWRRWWSVERVWALGAALTIAMHGFISARLFQMDYELGVIPWNATFMGLAYWLFWAPFRHAAVVVSPATPPARGARRPRAVKPCSASWAVLVALFVVFPLGCHLNLADSYLSFSMYTGNEAKMWLRVYDEPLGDGAGRGGATASSEPQSATPARTTAPTTAWTGAAASTA